VGPPEDAVNDLKSQIDEIPVTLVVAVAYGTLAVLTGSLGIDSPWQALDRHGWLTPADAVVEPWRLLSSAFLHGNVIHLLFNLSMLFGIGPALERTLGSVRFALLYVVAALGGSFGVCLLNHPFSPVVGGSGALFGMLGAAVALNVRSGRHSLAFLDFEGPRRLLGMIVANLLLGFFLPMISNTAHIGGLVAGFLVTLLWLEPGRAVTAQLWAWRAAATALFAGLLFHSLMPVTRADWLFERARRAPVAEQLPLQRAMEMARTGAARVSDHEAAMAFAQWQLDARQRERERKRR
jgi:membrane associated rhomboid family serine protease